MKIFISVFGGLGNQMFQYAYMLSWRALGQRAEICPISFRMKDHNGFELPEVFGPVRKDVGFSWSRFVFAVYRGFKKVFPKRLHDKVDNVLGVKTIVQSDHARYEDKCNDVTQGKRIVFCRGVWQSEKYFVSAVSEVRDAFKFDEEQLSDNSRSVLKKIRETNAVSIHVRRGDYLSFGNWSEMCPLDYYKRAFALVSERVENPYFFVFSDDKDYVKQYFDMENCTVVDFNSGKDSWQDMCLMSNCKSNIIANSTFSWWGAWLNGNLEKVVVAPKCWFPGSQEDDIVPDGWIRL